ncbi:DUF4013 domain-containing protein [Methanobacterium aggregans]|uniref:DUF4013 domain-containing protein n=1 Tax=Methanobacterium aggregans TaxID=1615586 RepID=UPI001AE24089|nr:DUF4013 domain-containing protein [Methanobacterium aggregans]MBP2046716.1 type IV secretory pathway TrbL component [Methanobacterium aggregans]
MNVNRNIIDSLRYPLKDWVKLILLGIILIIPVVNFIGLGYYLRIIKSTLAGSDELPDFEGVGELFTDGIKFLAVCMIYAIVPLLFYALSSAFPGSATLPIMATSFALIISIFAYVGIANMAFHGSEIGAGLRYGEILDRIAAIGWGSYILWWIVLTLIITVAGFIIGMVGGILLFFVLGLPVVLLGYGYLMIFHARSVALTFAS